MRDPHKDVLFNVHVDCSDRQRDSKVLLGKHGTFLLRALQLEGDSPPLIQVPARILQQHATGPPEQPSDTACPNSQLPSDLPVAYRGSHSKSGTRTSAFKKTKKEMGRDEEQNKKWSLLAGMCMYGIHWMFRAVPLA